MMCEKQILVAGGAGFIGSHLCDRLVLEGHRVLCMDNLYTGKIENIEHLLTHPMFCFIEHDINTPFATGEISKIFNLACPASPVHYQKNAVYTTKTAVLGTLNLLELARLNKCPILQASTSEVYGSSVISPQTENYWGNVNSTGVRSCYDEGKRCSESLCMDYHRQYGLKVKVVRIFNTYGPNMAADDGRVISNFIVQSLRSENITVYGSGTQTRSFMFISDLIEALMRMMNTNDECTGPVNLGNPEECTIMELAEKIIHLTGTTSAITHRPLSQDDPQRRCPDISMATRLLNGWQPQIGLEEGLKKTIKHLKNKIL